MKELAPHLGKNGLCSWHFFSQESCLQNVKENTVLFLRSIHLFAVGAVVRRTYLYQNIPD